MDYFTEFYSLQLYGHQIDSTLDAIVYLFDLGCSVETLKPYTEHLDYLNSMMKKVWNDFKKYVEQDEVRMKMCNEINWFPVYGCKYQEIVSDPDFQKRWSYFDKNIDK